MGTDTPIAVAVRAAAAALRLLHPAVRPGHQPAAGRDPRGARHLAARPPSARSATCSSPTPASLPPGRAAVPGDRQRRARQDRPHQRTTATMPGFATHVVRGLYDVAGGGDGAAPSGSTRSAPRSSAAIADGARFIVLSDRDSDRRPRADPVAAADRRVHHHLVRREDPHPGRPARRGRRRPRGAPRRAADRLRRRRGQPVPGDGDRRGPRPRAATSPASTPAKAVANLIKALGKGVLKVMSQDGHLHGRLLHRRPGLRGDRPRARTLVDRYFTGTDVAARRRRPRRDRRGGRSPGTRAAYPRGRHRARAPRARDRRRVPVAPRGRAAPVRPRDGLPAAALHPRRPLRHLQAVHRARSTSSPSG